MGLVNDNDQILAAEPAGVKPAPWTRSADDVLVDLGVRPEVGLDAAEVAKRRQQFGDNTLKAAERRSTLRILVDQLRSTVVALLAVAAVLSFVFGGPTEGFAIVAVIVINTLIGFGVELKAVRSMDALRLLGSVRSRVRRETRSAMLRADEIVPGDILVLEAGDTVTADCRIVTASRLRVDESTFTGESVPTDKQSEAIGPVDRVDERRNMLYRGTSLTMGSCEAVVVATGMQTELGKISELAQGSGSEQTPLEQQLARVGNKLIAITVLIVIAVVIAGTISGRTLHLMIETGVALAVATIPEGLPIVATIALARGLWRMSQRNALINRLSAVETLGSTSILCTDKTGTLTENRMELAHIWLDSGDAVWAADTPSDQPDLRTALELGVLCNRASLGGGQDAAAAVGDPLEVALLVAGVRLQLVRHKLLEDAPEIAAEAFDSTTKMMATYHQQQSDVLVAVKGAPEAVIPRCVSVLTQSGEQGLDDPGREAWLARGETLAQQGLRVIAVARKLEDSPSDNPYERLTLVALLGLIDPPRLQVRQAIADCRSAGIRVLMITGDHPATAGAIAKAVGLGQAVEDGAPPVALGSTLDDPQSLSKIERDRVAAHDLFARVSPAQKLNLIRLHQEAGEVVGMIGDGVNDAPALEQADIGIAMGQRGTQVAREAAEMVLRDDAFSSIVVAVRQGRVIFGNIRRFVVYLLSCNISEVMILAIASMIKAPMPILPLQILFLNLVSDIFPALALGVGSGSAEVMNYPPRDPKEGILTRANGRWIFGFGVLLTASVLTVFFLSLGPLDLTPKRAVTVAFLTLAFSQLWHVFNMADPGSPVLRNEITQNAFVWGALILCTLLLLIAVYVRPLAALLKLERPTLFEWALIAGFSVIPVVIGQGYRALTRALTRASA